MRFTVPCPRLARQRLPALFAAVIVSVASAQTPPTPIPPVAPSHQEVTTSNPPPKASKLPLVFLLLGPLIGLGAIAWALTRRSGAERRDG